MKAVVVAAPDARLTEADVIGYARGRLGGFKLPKTVDFVDRLPRTPSGKILKRALREPYWADAGRRIG